MSIYNEILLFSCGDTSSFSAPIARQLSLLHCDSDLGILDFLWTFLLAVAQNQAKIFLKEQYLIFQCNFGLFVDFRRRFRPKAAQKGDISSASTVQAASTADHQPTTTSKNSRRPQAYGSLNCSQDLIISVHDQMHRHQLMFQLLCEKLS